VTLVVLCCTETESYVADELMTSRAGVRIRIGNTDAEGRMVMADVLCQMKEKVFLFFTFMSEVEFCILHCTHQF